jgi:hypothetical protein
MAAEAEAVATAFKDVELGRAARLCPPLENFRTIARWQLQIVLRCADEDWRRVLARELIGECGTVH